MKLRVVYAKRSYKGKVYSYPLIQYSYRDENGTPRHKTVASLSKLPEHLVLLIEQAFKIGDTATLQQHAPINIFYRKAIAIGAVVVAIHILSVLGIIALLKSTLTKVHALIAVVFIVERIIFEKPLSISALSRQFEGSAIHYLLGEPATPGFNSWYYMLDALEDARESILKELYRRHPKISQIFLYDITSTYFEGQKCPLAAFGYNRDGKAGKMQVVIGIICDSEGRPIWCDVFKGNTSDQTTVRQQLLNLKENLGVKEFIFVGDRGMITSARIEELENDGWWEAFGYITALKRSEIMRLIEDEKHPLQPELFDHSNLASIEYEGEQYIVCHNPYRQKEDAETREILLRKTEVKLAAIQKSVSAGRLKKKDKIARRLYRWINKWGMERFFEVSYDEGRFIYERRQEEIERYQAIDGCYVIRAKTHGKKMSPAELVARYKSLGQVEQAFRTMKTKDIMVRPIRVWTEKRVRGYIFGCFLAYLATWEIRQRLAAVLERDAHGQCEAGSLLEIFRSLDRISLGFFEINDESHTEISEISRPNRKLLDLLGVTSIDRLISIIQSIL